MISRSAKRGPPWIELLTLLLCYTSTWSDADPSPRPVNLVVIHVDQLGWGDVGVYSPWQTDTPNIDQLAAGGVILDNLYSETSATATSATFLSGALAVSWGLYSSNNAEDTQLPEDSGFFIPNNTVQILPQVLKTKGYTTKYIGRWNLGQRSKANPTNFGFDSFLGTVSDLGPKFDNLRFPNVGFYRNENIVARIYGPNLTMTEDDLLAEGVSNLTKVYTDDMKVFITKSKDIPFYLHVSLDALKNRPYRSPKFVDSSADSRGTNFTDALREIDEFVGVMIQAITDSDLADKTLVLFAAQSTALASHYEGGSNSPFTGATGDSTEGGVRVPGIISCPGINFRKKRSKQLINFADLHATALSMLGFIPEDCDDPKCVTGGMNLTEPLVTGNITAGHRDLITIFRGRTLMAFRKGRYKIHLMSRSSFVPGQFLDNLTSYKLHNTTDLPILFDVVADPGERFFIGNGFEITRSRYTDVLPDMKAEAEYIKEHVKLSEGLLNECNVAWREWTPPGCLDLELCIPSTRESKVRMCNLPEWSGLG